MQVVRLATAVKYGLFGVVKCLPVTPATTPPGKQLSVEVNPRSNLPSLELEACDVDIVFR